MNNEIYFCDEVMLYFVLLNNYLNIYMKCFNSVEKSNIILINEILFFLDFIYNLNDKIKIIIVFDLIMLVKFFSLLIEFFIMVKYIIVVLCKICVWVLLYKVWKYFFKIII